MTHNWRKHSLTWGKRIVLVLLFVGAASYGVLSLAERSKEQLRKGLEDYLIKASGQRAEITDLSEAKLVPDVLFNMRGINIRDAADPQKVYVHADTAYLMIPFWRLMLGIGGYAAMEVKGLEVASGFYLPKKLTVDFGGISDPDPKGAPPQFVVEGQYNNLPLLVTMGMARKLTKKGPLYSFQGTSSVSFKLGRLEGNGIYTRHFSKVTLDEGHIVRGVHDVKFIAEDIDKKPLKIWIRGQIDSVPFNAMLTKKGESNVLTITPETADREGLLKIESFIKDAKEDLGLSDNDDALTITIAAPEPSAPAKESKTP